MAISYNGPSSQQLEQMKRVYMNQQNAIDKLKATQNLKQQSTIKSRQTGAYSQGISLDAEQLKQYQQIQQQALASWTTQTATEISTYTGPTVIWQMYPRGSIAYSLEWLTPEQEEANKIFNDLKEAVMGRVETARLKRFERSLKR